MREHTTPPAHASVDDEPVQTALSLLKELEASLEASQQALLSRSLLGLEQATAEQARLLRALSILWPWNASTPGARSAGAQSIPRAGICPAGLSPVGLPAPLLAAQARVLHLGRVQAALLARAERWLRVVSHLLAGPNSTYRPPEINRKSLATTLRTARLTKDGSCRV